MGHRSKNPAFSMVRKIAEDGRVTPQPNRIPHPSRCIGCFPRSRTTPRQPEAPPSHKRERHEPGPPSAAFSYPSQTVIHRDKISAHDPVPQPRPKSPPHQTNPATATRLTVHEVFARKTYRPPPRHRTGQPNHPSPQRACCSCPVPYPAPNPAPIRNRRAGRSAVGGARRRRSGRRDRIVCHTDEQDER